MYLFKLFKHDGLITYNCVMLISVPTLIARNLIKCVRDIRLATMCCYIHMRLVVDSCVNKISRAKKYVQGKKKS